MEVAGGGRRRGLALALVVAGCGADAAGCGTDAAGQVDGPAKGRVLASKSASPPPAFDCAAPKDLLTEASMQEVRVSRSARSMASSRRSRPGAHGGSAAATSQAQDAASPWRVGATAFIGMSAPSATPTLAPG